ncbi:hypothetical protein K4E_00040 [Enterococcus thailandicus]|nr:hypothetical protein K4E_00040 [Enterococcus thailandicus]
MTVLLITKNVILRTVHFLYTLIHKMGGVTLFRNIVILLYELYTLNKHLSYTLDTVLYIRGCEGII